MTKYRVMAIFWLFSLMQPISYGVEASAALNSPIDNFWVYEDVESRYSSATIQSIQDDRWVNHKSPNLNLGYVQSTVWVKFNISNDSGRIINRILDINYPLLDSVEFYKASKSGELFNTMSSGDTKPFSVKNINHPNHIEQFTLSSGERATYYVKIKSNSPIQSQFIIWDFNEFQDHYRLASGVNFFYLGLVLSIVIFNLFVYIFLKEIVYLSYTIYALFFALLMASQSGLLFEYIYPESPSFQNWSQLIFASGAISFTAIFNYHFLKINNKSTGSKILKAFAIIPIIIAGGSLVTGFGFSIKAIVLCALIIVPICFFVGVIHSRKRRDKNLYLLAWVWLIVGVIVFLLQKLGFIPFNTLTTNSIQIGSALELITFAIALARRIHTERETRIHAQQIIIENSKRTALLHKEMLSNATHHPITKLPNRMALEAWIDENTANYQGFKVVLIKLSRINEIDKTLGRRFSEEALKVFSERLNNEISKMSHIIPLDTQSLFKAATLNSNTHGIILNQTEDDASELLSSLKIVIDAPMEISIMEIEPYVTISYSSYPDDGDDAVSLLRHAGIAMDQSTLGEQSIVQYKSEIDPYNERRLSMMSELNRAIFNNNLELHFQPLVDTHNKDILGAEALIRWPHAEYGMIMPDQFIQSAEQTGVIQSLSLWVLKSAIKQQLKWIKAHPSFLLSVNISAFNLQDKKFMEAVQILFNEHKELARNIILEITETQMMTDTHHALKHLWQLSEIGFHIAIDDFGTGYSNLAYLKKLPASELKIDKSFILNLESDKQNQVLVQTAIHMAHNLGLKVVAEGVESERSRAILSEMGCDMCQGFHFSRPVPVDQFNELLTTKPKNIL